MTDPAVEVVTVEARCGCGDHDTRVRIDGRPWWFLCYARAHKPVPNFLHDLKLPQYAPRVQRGGAMRDPTWCPPAADVQDIVQHAAFTWSRPYDGPTVVLDRGGAHVAAAASVDVAWGPLKHTGLIQWAGLPGNYLVEFHEWTEQDTPHPLGGGAILGRRTGHVWVPHTRVKLLADLAVQGRWPDLRPMDSWTCETKVRLDKWAKHINTLRCEAIDQYGRDSAEYAAVKNAFSRAIAMMVGKKEAGSGRRWDGSVHRTDWAFSIQDLAACTMWRWLDDLNWVARSLKTPELAPVGIQHADELVIPADALNVFPCYGRSRGRAPLELDPTGKKLGTFKVKPRAE